MGDVPAVSNARRRIERLRGVQFCRRALEIRSENSAPALIRPHGFGGNLGLFVPDVFWFGRAGNGRNRLRRWRSWAAAGSARTRQGTLGSLDSPFAAAPLDKPSFCLEAQAQAVTTTAQRRRFALRRHQKRTQAIKPPPRRRRPRLLNAAAVARGLRPPAAPLDGGLFQNIHRSAHSYQQGQLFDKTRMGLVFWSLLC